jgi:putative ABC transport system substrate-binding protein
MRRREFIRLIGGAAATLLCPATTVAQQPAMPVVGLLEAVPRVSATAAIFLQGLAEEGFIEGRNVSIESRSADGHYERLPGLATELVRQRVTVIATVTPVAALAAKGATTTIPIVFELGSDPVKDGLVASLNRPGGNITGVTFFANLLSAKRLEVLHDIVPTASVVGFLSNPQNANAEAELTKAQAGARALNLRLIVVQAARDSEVEAAMMKLAQQHVTALAVAGDAYLTGQREQIAALSLRYGIATCVANREQVEAGSLVSYGASRPESSRQFGLYVGRVLKGEKPADLPVVQPAKFEIVINLKTAKALGLTISRELLFRADEVIE